MSKKIVILNGYNYNGGPIALSVMCRELRKLGYDASLLMVPTFPNNAKDNINFTRGICAFQIKSIIKTYICRIFKKCKFVQRPEFDVFKYRPVKGCKYKLYPFVNFEKSIVVYPEIVFGNPFKAPNVVRWLLFHNRYKNQPQAYDKSDMFIAYSDFFNDSELNPLGYRITFSFFDKNLYKQYNFGERKGNCYILRKGKGRTDLPNEFDGPVFDDNMTQEELVRIFNEHKYCYSYDTKTFYTKIAAVCGCIPIVVEEKVKSVNDYHSATEDSHYGVAYGNTQEQIEYAISTREKMIELLDYDQKNEANAKEFVRIIEERFGPIKRIKNKCNV
jgi:hypothetical protein